MIAKRDFKALALAFLAAALAGCAHRRPGLNYQVPASCHAAAKLLGCDQSDPPHCRAVKLRYDKDCEVLDSGR